jgi:sugar phosphate isomerase/epimerase
MNCKHLRIVAALSSILVAWQTFAGEATKAGLPNPFYAMDTAFRRPGLTTEQQLDLVKELGFAGIAWTETAPEQARATAESAEKRGLKMYTIYCAAAVTPEGDLKHSPNLPKLMEALKGHGTIIWLHIGGKGPAFDSLTGKEPLIEKLRGLADTAAANDLRIAVYPHVGEWTARFGDATRLAKVVNHPRFGVTFNLCHCMAMGDEEKIPALLDDAKPVLVTVTICGADTGVKSPQWGRLIQTLDRGTFDQGMVLRKLKGSGFTGPIGFQGYGIRGDARSILSPTIEAWRKLSAAAAGETGK